MVGNLAMPDCAAVVSWSASPVSATTAGPASTGRRAPRWWTRPSRRWRRSRPAGTTAVAAASSPHQRPATRCRPRPAPPSGELLGAPAESIWFGPNMTTMTLAFTRALARDWAPGRPDRLHPARSRRRRHLVAAGRRGPRRGGRRRTDRPPHRPAPDRVGAGAARRAGALGGGGGRVEPARLHAGPAGHRPRPRTPPARGSSSTPWPWPCTVRSTWRPSGATRS